MMDNLSIICSEVRDLVIEVAAYIEEESRLFDPNKIEYKEFNNLVSYVDKIAEQKLVQGLRIILPEAGFITEEGTAGNAGEQYKWVIDPLDGTTNFAHGVPFYSISVALTNSNMPVIGVVYEVNSDECFYAWKGGGAYRNGNRIHVSKNTQLSQALLATGFPYYMFDKLEVYLKLIGAFIPKTQGIRRMGSAAVDLCYVACGRFDGYFEFNLNTYDVMAGILLVQEAGGYVSNFTGGDEGLYTGEEVLASGMIYPSMIEVVKGIWK